MARLIILLAVFAILAVLLVRSRRKGRWERVASVGYERRHLFDASERAFLAVLDEAADGRVRAFAKVGLDDLVQVPAAVALDVRRDARHALRRGRVDFVVCDPADLRVLAVVLLDDTDHAGDRAETDDAIVTTALAPTGIPVLRFAARTGTTVEEVRRRLEPVLATVPPALEGSSVARPRGVAADRGPYARLGSCPTCGRPMVERVGKRGALKGKPYLVCGGDPPCGTVVAVD